MSKKGFTIQELLTRDVIRPNMPYEWLTKISFREFNRWARGEASIIKFRGGTSKEAVNLHIETEIENQEKLYQALKTLSSPNGLKKAKTTFDLVSTPSSRDAVWTGNGRIHRVDKYEPLTASTKNVYYDPKSMYGEKFVYEEEWKEKHVTYRF